MPDLPAALHLPGSPPAPAPTALHLPDDDPVLLVRAASGEAPDPTASPPLGEMTIFVDTNPIALFSEVHTWYGFLSSTNERTYGGPFELEWQTTDVTNGWGSDDLFLHTKGFDGDYDCAHIFVALSPFTATTGGTSHDLRDSVMHTNGIAEYRYSGNTYLAIKYLDANGDQKYALSNESIITGYYDEDPVPASFALNTFTFEQMEAPHWQGDVAVPTDEVLKNALAIGYRTSQTTRFNVGDLAGVRGLWFTESTPPPPPKRYVFPQIPYLGFAPAANPMASFDSTFKHTTPAETHLRDLRANHQLLP